MKRIPTALAALLLATAANAQAQKPQKPQSPDHPRQPTTLVKPEPANQEDSNPNDDEHLAIAAVEGLMAQPSERALPILKKVLAGSQPTVVKRRALFVLAQIGAPEAH